MDSPTKSRTVRLYSKDRPAIILGPTARGPWTVRALATDRPPVQFLADAPQRLYGWLRAIKATQPAHSWYSLIYTIHKSWVFTPIY
jgi:hypothetical protein